MNRAFCTIKKTFKKVTHVIFDLDGLLLDTESIYKKAFNDVAQKYGKIYTPEVRSKVIGRTELEGATVAVTEMKLPISPEDFAEQYKAISLNSLPDVGLMPGAERLVRHFHSNKIPIAVATSSAFDNYELKITKHKAFFSLFSHVVAGGSDPDVKRGKPSPEIFQVCASRFQDKPKPEQCLVFEDAPNGAEAAIAAGMQVVIVPEKEIDANMYKQATLKLDSLEEVEPELFGLPPLK